MTATPEQIAEAWAKVDRLRDVWGPLNAAAARAKREAKEAWLPLMAATKEECEMGPCPDEPAKGANE